MTAAPVFLSFFCFLVLLSNGVDGSQPLSSVVQQEGNQFATNDSCAGWIADVLGKQHCDSWYRDTIISFFKAAGKGVAFSSQNLNTSCSCGPTAFFVNFLFSGATRMQHSWAQPFTNDTIRAYLEYTKVVGSNNDDYPSAKLPNGTTRCNRLSHSAGQLQDTLIQLRCEMGLPPCNTTASSDAKRVVQVAINWDEVMDGLDHTFTLQRAGQDEYYLWQGYVANYDLYAWINQLPTPRWNNPSWVWGPPSNFHGRLSAAQLLLFIEKIEAIVLAAQSIEEGLQAWQDLFWVPIPPAMMKSLHLNCNYTLSSVVPMAIMLWSQPYGDNTCKENWASMSATAWTPEHERERQQMCASLPSFIPCEY